MNVIARDNNCDHGFVGNLFFLSAIYTVFERVLPLGSTRIGYIDQFKT
jgi:hypothetical protein